MKPLSDSENINLGVQIHHIVRLMRTRFAKRAKAVDLTRAQYRAVAAVRRMPGATQSDIAQDLAITTVTLGRIVDRLELSGWLERRPDPRDRRVNRIYVNETAKNKLGKMSALALEEQQAALRNFSVEEAIMLGSMLDRIIDNLSAQDK